MADIIDQAGDHIEREADARQAEASARAAAMPKGTPGDCELCGEWSGRLVNNACAPCRDRYKLP
ncbi:conjugal transfer protein TraR [Bordetella genomosp. 1]|uniref:Conjugal transfer protein TraR n=1 Tax=Bordetella genomosp. 1 TaxID=1395607 RepID=A0ABX4EWD0_9BORD|nr:conjugal transfer protein TraR [Bordetella genomosp. 1]OZI58743.1 conjugal transfer protein TraR [Bordetella genomosp. 1]